MAGSHRSHRADIGLRVLGLVSCAGACGAITLLVALKPASPTQSAGLVIYGLAAISFVVASAGASAMVLGHHLFDHVELNLRWQVRHDPSADNRQRHLSGKEPPMTTPDCTSEILVVGRDIDGGWTVRESAGLLMGRFASDHAARLFAASEQRARPTLSIALSSGDGTLSRCDTNIVALGGAGGIRG